MSYIEFNMKNRVTKKFNIYVAGPLTSSNPIILKKNINVAKKIGEEILRKGHFPYVPHTHFHNWDIDLLEHYSIFYLHGIEIIRRWADAIFFIGPSKGANRELKIAKDLGLIIFTNLSQIEKLNS